MNLDSSAIRRVTQYVASPVTSCDRCAAGIKYVSVVTYKDGQSQKFGSECINKILDGNVTLLGLFKKNSVLLRRYKDYATILSGPVDLMPRGREYFGAGLYFIADSQGKDIFVKSHWFFHPQMDAERNAASGRYISDPAEFATKELAAIARDLPWLNSEIDRLELFLAKVMRAAAPAVIPST